jgi:class 3 adenylate cyclase
VLDRHTSPSTSQAPTWSVVPGDDHLPWEGDQGALVGEIERFLAHVEHEAEPNRVLATVLFTDLVGSTAKAVELGDREWRRLLDRHYQLVRAHLGRFRGQEVDIAGDGVFALFDGPARGVRCAAALARAVRGLDLELRAGLHTGEVELEDGRPTGVAIHIGARVVALAGPGEVLVSSTVKDIVAGSGIRFGEWGRAELKGVPGEWTLFRVESP